MLIRSAEPPTVLCHKSLWMAPKIWASELRLRRRTPGAALTLLLLLPLLLPLQQLLLPRRSLALDAQLLGALNRLLLGVCPGTRLFGRGRTHGRRCCRKLQMHRSAEAAAASANVECAALAGGWGAAAFA